MHNKFISGVIAKTLLLLSIIPATVFSQITITSPVPSAVYQRDVTGQRTITVTGTFTVPMDKIEIRALPVLGNQGIPTPWDTLQTAPKGGVFKGNITLFQGWYTVEVRASLEGRIVGRGVLQRLGVGEVFLIAGQSNAQGLKKYTTPSAVDERVLYVSNYENDELGTYPDLLTDPVPPTFSKITSELKTMSPRGQTSWCWGILGDMLVTKLGVPVLFINTAWEGSAIENWAESAKGIPTTSKYGYRYNPGMPYANLRIAARNYANQYGIRAVLWMQGETDSVYGTTAAVYRENLQFIMNKLGQETGKRITWVIARTSRTAPNGSTISRVFPTIIAAQNAVLDTQFNPTWPGPETDDLVPNRPDGTHFTGSSPSDFEGTKAALTVLADAWNKSLDLNFFGTVLPSAPAEIPKLTASCAASNDAVSISLPTGYASYEWSNGAKGNTITVTEAGTYRATVRDAVGNSILSSVVVLDNRAKPAQPVIAEQGTQQACADSSFQFSVTGGKDIYNWYKENTNTSVATGAAVKISESGNYIVKAQNIFGCISENSAPSSLIIRPAVPKPIIESSGPFSISARIEGAGLDQSFIWRRPGTESDTIADLIKILKTGVYTARAAVTYIIKTDSLTCYSDTASREFKTNESNEVVIYPNPSQGNFIYIESREDIKDASITLYDIFGRVLKTTPPKLLNSQLKLDVSNLPTGKYILRVTGQDQSLTKQIVVR